MFQRLIPNTARVCRRKHSSSLCLRSVLCSSVSALKTSQSETGHKQRRGKFELSLLGEKQKQTRGSWSHWEAAIAAHSSNPVVRYSALGALFFLRARSDAEVLCQEGPASYWDRQKLPTMCRCWMQYAVNESELCKCLIWPCIVTCYLQGNSRLTLQNNAANLMWPHP